MVGAYQQKKIKKFAREKKQFCEGHAFSNQCLITTFADSFEMLKALYDFQAVYPKTISFFEGEHFILHQTSVKQRNWWQVINMKGSIGLYCLA